MDETTPQTPSPVPVEQQPQTLVQPVPVHSAAKRLVWAVLVIGVLLGGYVLWKSHSGPKLESIPFVDSQNGFSIQAPKGWQVDASGNFGKVAFINLKTRSTIFVASELVSDMSRQGYVAGYKEAFPSQVILAERDVSVGGFPATEIEYTDVTTEGKQTHSLMEILVVNGTAYDVEAGAPAEYWDEQATLFRASLASFKIVSR